MPNLNNDESLSSSRKQAVLATIDPINATCSKFKELLIEYVAIPLSYKKVARRIMLSRIEEILDELERNPK